MIKAVRGTRDILPPETALWNFVESAVRDVFRAYNFQEIRTPIFESTELFARGVGEETDIVSKEMYTWEDRGRAPKILADAAIPDVSARYRINLSPFALRPRPALSEPTSSTSLGSRAEQAVLHRPDVPARTAAEGAVPAVLSDRCRSDWAGVGGERVSGAGCGSAGDAGDFARPAGDHGLDSRAEFGGLSERSREVQRGAAQGVGAGGGKDVRGLPAAGGDQSAARVRLQGAGGSADHRDAAAHQPVSG